MPLWRRVGEARSLSRRTSSRQKSCVAVTPTSWSNTSVRSSPGAPDAVPTVTASERLVAHDVDRSHLDDIREPLLQRALDE